MQKEKVADWSMASSFVNSQIGIKPDQSLSAGHQSLISPASPDP
jgi:hypothetical protein